MLETPVFSIRCDDPPPAVAFCEVVASWEVALPRPKAVPIRIASGAVKSASFQFPEAPQSANQPANGSRMKQPVASGPAPGGQRPAATHLRPPRDVVKLVDRLYYVLQPPLESLIGGGSLKLPFEPFPYQFQGIGFLYPRVAAILADEMGLGKTMQAISAIRLLLCAGEIRSVLLICPKPLVENWKREFALWAPETPLAIIEGDQAKRRWLWEQANAPVKIANYELLMRDRELVGEGQAHFDLVVLDEAQRIKNRSSATSQVVRSISRRRSWALTGTPVENGAEDLVGIFEFLAPGLLSADLKASHLGKAASDYILRRTKEMVLSDMPPKLYRDAQLDLTPAQYESYRTAEDEGVIKLSEMGAEVTIQHVFELILRLKQICNFDPLTGESSKFERLAADLEEVAASGKKAIVFSQWVGTLDALASRLEAFRPLPYHGRIPSRQRESILAEFAGQPDRRVLLMSYGAGSVGLNLQFCEYVFLFDRWWNPAVEDQAINRAHRIGARGAVTVTRMLTLGTIEERIDQILQEKRQLFSTIFSEAGAPRSMGLTHEEIFGLFRLKSPIAKAA